MQPLIDAPLEGGVKRFVLLSALGLNAGDFGTGACACICVLVNVLVCTLSLVRCSDLRGFVPFRQHLETALVLDMKRSGK